MICDIIKGFILVCGVIPLCLAAQTQIHWFVYRKITGERS